MIPLKSIIIPQLQHSTKDIMTAGLGASTVLASTFLSNISMVINVLVGLGVLTLTILRIFSWFERRKQKRLEAEE